MSNGGSFYKDEIDYDLLKIVKGVFFDHHADIIDVRLKGEGNAVDNNRFMFATWAGPTADVGNLLHEMGHFVEINPERCHRPGWGLGYGKKIVIGGREYDEGMHTKKAIEREIRTFAIQLVLSNHYGITVDDDDSHDSKGRLERYFAIICRWVDGFHLYKTRDDDLSYNEQEQSAIDTIEQLIVEESKKWTFDSIRAAWEAQLINLRNNRANGCWEDYY